jgi:predicted RNase H-related nuclease YkuK (DUF458 family)
MTGNITTGNFKTGEGATWCYKLSHSGNVRDMIQYIKCKTWVHVDCTKRNALTEVIVRSLSEE